MPKLLCPCGFVHNLSPIPDDGWLTIRDKDYESLSEADRTIHEVSGGKSLPSDEHPQVNEYDAAMAYSSSLMGRLYECPQCGRIMWKKPAKTGYVVFQPDP